MENLTQYLDKSLIPLEDKVKEYLSIERDIRILDVELLSLQSIKSDFNPNQNDLEQEMKGGAKASDLNDKEKKMATLLDTYNHLREELINMLPEQNKFIEINLGYGPSMVGYFTIDHETRRKLPEPVLRVVH
jgi:chromosome segregation ATPase